MPALPQERAAINGTVEATNRLKGLYLRLQEAQRERMAQISRVQATVRAQTHENVALVRALAEKGVHVDVKAMSDTLRKGSGGARAQPVQYAAPAQPAEPVAGRSKGRRRKNKVRLK